MFFLYASILLFPLFVTVLFLKALLFNLLLCNLKSPFSASKIVKSKKNLHTCKIYSFWKLLLPVQPRCWVIVLPTKTPFLPLCSQVLLSLEARVTTNLFSALMVLPFLEHYIDGIIQYVAYESGFFQLAEHIWDSSMLDTDSLFLLSRIPS